MESACPQSSTAEDETSQAIIARLKAMLSRSAVAGLVSGYFFVDALLKSDAYCVRTVSCSVVDSLIF